MYWIREVGNTEPESQGYIGVTNDPKRRWKRHRNKVSKPKGKRSDYYKVYREMRSKGLNRYRFEILHRGLDKNSAYHIEYALRPHDEIGLNTARGGYPTSPKKLSPIDQECQPIS
ncbi:GIY-YIG nuclease family protein [Neiella litorisoli]|uniref:GIY-YIG nuclease family protein n=1 Tax=Neiella litorisoli TaxID=2771431 RepID=UPI0034E1C0DB